MRNLAVNLILEEKITTTKTRARAASSFVEKLVTKAKKGGLCAIKTLSSKLPQPAVKKIISDIAPRFLQRNGGYTRIIKLGQRYKDGAEMAVVEFIDRDAMLAKAKEQKKAKGGPAKKAAKKETPKKAKKEAVKEDTKRREEIKDEAKETAGQEKTAEA